MKKVLLTLVVVGMMMMASAASALDAADVIFIVDESGSMAGEHAWIKNMVTDLETGLLAKGVGAGADVNNYGLVGFGGSYSHLPGHQHDVGGVGSEWGTAPELSAAANSLQLSGGTEDGWDAINFALNNYTFRAGAALNIVLITDEDRDNVNHSLSYNSIAAELAAHNAMLNVVINANLKAATGGARALGADADKNLYMADGSGGYTSTAAGSVSCTPAATMASGACQDYANLAWGTGGAAWDLNQLRAGGLTATSFSKAFVDIKVEEIQQQTNVPEPGTVLLLGAGLLGLIALKRKRRS